MTKGMTKGRRAAIANAAREVDALRADWKDGLAHYELRVQGQFKELARRMKLRAKGRQPAGLPSAKQAQDILDLLDKARIKPGKGRSKDLRRVEEALERALERLPPQN